MKNYRRKSIPFLEAFLSPLSGLIFQLLLYFLMGIEISEVSAAFIITLWVVISAATAMVFERMETID